MTVLAYDSFKRTFGTATNLIGPSWTFQVQGWLLDGSNYRIKPSDLGTDCCSLFTAGDDWPRDQYAQATIVSLTGNGVGSGGGVVVRGDTFSVTGYYVYVNDAAGNDTYIVRRLNGVATTLSTTDNGWVAGDIIYLEVSGQNIVVKKNGVQVASTTDASISYGRPGVAYSSTVTSCILDDFEAGDLNAAVSVPLLLLASDNFNRADSIGLGENWSSVTGCTLPDIVSNQASSSADPFSARYSAVSWPNDQYSQLTLTGTLATDFTDGAGVAVRMDSSGVRQCYRFTIDAYVAADVSQYAGVLTYQFGLSETDFAYIDVAATNDVIYLQVIGRTLTLKINGTTLFVVTDSRLTSGQAGVAGSGSPATITFDDWSGGGARNWILKR